MVRRASVLSGLVVAVSFGIALAPWPGAVRAEPDSEAAAEAVGVHEKGSYAGSRYRVLVIQTTPQAGEVMGLPLIADVSTGVDGALVPLATRAAAHGFFATIPNPNDFEAAVRKQGGIPKIVLFAEGETTAGRTCSIVTGTRFPVHSIQLRGDARTVTTQFEKVGMQVKVEPFRDNPGELTRPGIRHTVSMEFSAISAFARSGSPVISQFASQGEVALPDGHMAVFAFFDRVRAETLGAGADGLPAKAGEGDPAAEDALRMYFVCLVRMDVG